jgi:hypothetical protein
MPNPCQIQSVCVLNSKYRRNPRHHTSKSYHRWEIKKVCVAPPNYSPERKQMYGLDFLSAEIAERANINEHGSRSIGSGDIQIILLYQQVLAGLA